jgi:hypothetical protein
MGRQCIMQRKELKLGIGTEFYPSNSELVLLKMKS